MQVAVDRDRRDMGIVLKTLVSMKDSNDSNDDDLERKAMNIEFSDVATVARRWNDNVRNTSG